MKKNVLITVGVLTGVACLGWFGVTQTKHAMLKKSIEEFRQNLGPSTSLSYHKARPGLLGRSVKFDQLVIRHGPETITADLAEISKPSASSGDVSHKISSISFHNFRLIDPAGSLSLETLQLEDVTLPADGDDRRGIPRQTLEIHHAQAHKLQGFISSLQSDLSADTVELENYGDDIPSRLESQNFRLSTDVAPQRHIKADLIMIDGVDLFGLYNSLATGTPLASRNGTRDIQVQRLSLSGDTPLMQVGTLRSRSVRSDTSEQEVSSLNKLELWPDVPNLSVLPSMGYKLFEGNLLLSDTRDFTKNTFKVNEFHIDGHKMGRLDITGTFGQTNATTLLSVGAADMPVHNIVLTYKDDGLVERALTASAKAHNTTPLELLTGLQAKFAPNGATPSDFFASLTTYFMHPDKGPLVINIKPARPLPLMALIAGVSMMSANPQLVSQIGISVQAP